ncbi:MAG TPA: hypothetical protein PK082_01465, partial [Phycisphaerae bacterium]|nr:hypothetical protein [Phycisphaerae bacterium]
MIGETPRDLARRRGLELACHQQVDRSVAGEGFGVGGHVQPCARAGQQRAGQGEQVQAASRRVGRKFLHAHTIPRAGPKVTRRPARRRAAWHAGKRCPGPRRSGFNEFGEQLGVSAGGFGPGEFGGA